MTSQNISGARQFLRDYVRVQSRPIESWLSGASRENFGAELIMLSLEARKIGDAYDLSGIALGSAMSLFKTVEGGYLAAQKVVAYNISAWGGDTNRTSSFSGEPAKIQKANWPERTICAKGSFAGHFAKVFGDCLQITAVPKPNNPVQSR